MAKRKRVRLDNWIWKLVLSIMDKVPDGKSITMKALAKRVSSKVEGFGSIYPHLAFIYFKQWCGYRGVKYTCLNEAKMSYRIRRKK